MNSCNTVTLACHLLNSNVGVTLLRHFMHYCLIVILTSQRVMNYCLSCDASQVITCITLILACHLLNSNIVAMSSLNDFLSHCDMASHFMYS